VTATTTDSTALFTGGSPSPVITQQPSSTTVASGSRASFSVTASPAATGNTLTYQWTLNGVNISGATSTTYQTPPLSSINDQSVYAVTVTDTTAGISVGSVGAVVSVISQKWFAPRVNQGYTKRGLGALISTGVAPIRSITALGVGVRSQDSGAFGAVGAVASSMTLASNPGSLTAGASSTFTGTNFGATGGSITVGGVSGTITAQSPTSITFTVNLGSQPYAPSTAVVYKRSDGATIQFNASLGPPSGLAYVTLTGIATTSTRIVAIPDLAIGDQLEYDTVGGKVTVNADGTFTTADTSVTGFSVRANDGTGWGTAGVQTIQAALLLPPAALTAVTLSDASISLNWPATTGVGYGLVGYNVYRNGSKITPSPISVTTFIDTGLTYNTTYSYTITSVDNTAAESPASSTASATTNNDTTPPVWASGSGLTAGATSTSQISLSWTPASDSQSGVKGYLLFRNGTQITAQPVAALTYSDQNLSPSTSYSYQIKAIDVAGNATALNPTAPVSATTLAVAVPLNVTVTGVTPTGATVTWTQVIGAASYLVRVNGVPLATNPTTPLALLSGLSSSTTYSVTVAAVDSASNTSAASQAVSFTTSAAVLPAPTGVSVSNITSTSFLASWNAVAGAAAYRVYLNGAAQTPDVGLLTLAFSGLQQNTNYAIAVAAVDVNGGLSPLSQTVSVRTGLVPPGAPSAPTISAITSSSATATWVAASVGGASLANYVVSVNGVPQAPVGPAVLTQNLTGLSANTPYTVIVTVTDTAGTTAVSPPTTFTTAQPIPTTPPTVPVASLVSQDTSSVTIGWTGSTGTGYPLAGYNVYRDGVLQNTGLLTTLTYTSMNLASGQSYVFAVSAVDTNGDESALSNTVVVTIAGGTPIPTASVLPVDRHGGGSRRSIRPRRQ
jgi:fibronectin type 3 domain-containing protein